MSGKIFLQSQHFLMNVKGFKEVQKCQSLFDNFSDIMIGILSSNSMYKKSVLIRHLQSRLILTENGNHRNSKILKTQLLEHL